MLTDMSFNFELAYARANRVLFDEHTAFGMVVVVVGGSVVVLVVVGGSVVVLVVVGISTKIIHHCIFYIVHINSAKTFCL